MSVSPTRVHGCHLVGSVPYPDTETVFRECVARMPDRLRRIPDGETGIRNYFTYWQFSVFKDVPQCTYPFVMNQSAPEKHFSPAEVEDNISKIKALTVNTGYDDAAIESYATFKRLKGEGVIPQGTKFQVCLPTAANLVIILYQQYRKAGFEVYEAALFRAMRRLQDEIPAEELSIQIDLAVDTGLWEGTYEKAWFDDPKEGSLQYILRMISQVDEGVELGLHNCYGDMENKHWAEPTSLDAVTERGLALLSRTPHEISYFHCPVPLSASDSEQVPNKLTSYLAPLQELYPALQSHIKGGCELYLGLVHPGDVEGTKARISVAQKFAPSFGVATECGLGRTPAEKVPDVFAISAAVSEPVSL